MNFRRTMNRRFVTADVPIAILDRPLDRLARKAGLTLHKFRGDDVVALRLPSARLVRIERPEPQWNPKEARRATVFVDATDIVKHGVTPIVKELLHVLKMPEYAVGWQADARVLRAQSIRDAKHRHFRRTPEPAP